jgi:hypothetical protein
MSRAALRELGHFEPCRRGPRQDSTRLIEQQLAGCSQLDPPADAIKQLDMELFLKRGDSVADRWIARD